MKSRIKLVLMFLSLTLFIKEEIFCVGWLNGFLGRESNLEIAKDVAPITAGATCCGCISCEAISCAAGGGCCASCCGGCTSCVGCASCCSGCLPCCCGGSSGVTGLILGALGIGGGGLFGLSTLFTLSSIPDSGFNIFGNDNEKDNHKDDHTKPNSAALAIGIVAGVASLTAIGWCLFLMKKKGFFRNIKDSYC